MAEPRIVDKAELVVTTESTILICPGLGSGIALVVHDPVHGVSGMAHMMLPASRANKLIDKPAKFVDSAVPEMIEQMERSGAHRDDLVVAYVGGAQTCKSRKQGVDLGERNVCAVQEALQVASQSALATDIGGTSGRSVTFSPSTGELRITATPGVERTLCFLKPQVTAA